MTNNPRRQTVIVRMRTDEKALVERAAEREGMRPATWLRRLALLTLSAKSFHQPEEFPAAQQ